MKSPKSISESRTHDPAIDGMRGLAILLVILSHVSACVIHDDIHPYSAPWLEALTRGGASGVSLFFVLSSFALMRSTSWRFENEALPRLGFYIRRAFRILPLWWCYIPLSAMVRHAPRSVIIPHLLMYFGFQKANSFTHIGWSLFVEETFYCFFPLIFLKLSRLRGAVVFFIVCLLISGRIPGFAPKSWASEWLGPFFRFPFYHYVTFGLGIFCFHFVKAKGLANSKVATWILDLSAAVLFVISFFGQSHDNLHIFSYFMLVLAALQPESWIRRGLQAEWLQGFGVCCYSIYLFHALILFWFRYTSLFHFLGSSPLTPAWQVFFGMIIASTLSYAVGYVSFEFFEKPCVRAGQRLIARLNSNPLGLFRPRSV